MIIPATNDKQISGRFNVVVIGSGTHKGVLQGNSPTPPTGKQVRVTGVWMHRIVGGKIAETWNHWDMMGMLQQLGVLSVHSK